MKPNIHPEYRDILFHDTAADAYFVIGSTLKTKETAEYEGKTYAYLAIDVSSESHPFYTGKQRETQNDGRVAKFKQRFNFKSKK